MSYDAEHETWKLKVIVVLIIVFLFSGFKSCTEIRYSIGGKETTGEFYKTYESGGYRRRRKHMVMLYKFKDEKGKEIKGRLEVSPSRTDEYLAQKPLKIIYLPSDPAYNMLVSERSLFFPILFVIMASLLIAGIIWLFKQADYDKPKKRRK